MGDIPDDRPIRPEMGEETVGVDLGVQVFAEQVAGVNEAAVAI